MYRFQVVLTMCLLLSVTLATQALAEVGETVWDGVIVDRAPVYDGYPSHLFVEGVHHIWYCGASGVTSDDGIFYTTKSTSLSQPGGWSTPVEVLNNTNVAWTTQHLCDPNVIRGDFSYAAQSYEYAMYFTGDDGTAPEGIRAAVGVAFSNDLVNWVTHPTRIITATDPLAAEYGAGQSTVAWSPDNSNTLLQLYRDSTAAFGVDSEVFLTSTSDGVNYAPVPGTATLMPEAGVNAINATSPDIAYNPLDGHWYALMTTHGFTDNPPDFRIRLLRARTRDTLLAEWEQLAEWDSTDSGEETNIEAGLARNENGSLYVDDEGWTYVFITVGEWIPNFNTWAIAQTRYRVIEPTDTTIADTFTNMGPRRLSGEPLNGQWTEFGGRQWFAESLLEFGAEGVITVGSDDSGETASIPFVPTPGSPIATVEARVDLAGSDWISIGFSSTPFGLFQGEVFLLLHNLTGNVQVLVDGTTYTLSQMPAPGLNAGWNRLHLEVDTVNNTVSAWCNGVRILDRFDLGSLNGGAGFTPNIQHAVFHMFRPDAGASRIDDFAVSQNRYIFLGDFETGNLSTWDDTCLGCGP